MGEGGRGDGGGRGVGGGDGGDKGGGGGLLDTSMKSFFFQEDAAAKAVDGFVCLGSRGCLGIPLFIYLQILFIHLSI